MGRINEEEEELPGADVSDEKRYVFEIMPPFTPNE